MNAHAFVDRTVILADDNIYDDIHKKCEFVKQKINADNSLTKKAKAEAIKILNETYDRDKVNINSGIKRICERSPVTIPDQNRKFYVRIFT
uniref:Uncharacterized protein n=1 Tax=Rhizophagus irregularis (strain DAOM 181602 / DAOM 197198 / MUCL 43194) TaxID=747089 RepID=U9TJ70_RHIID